MSDILSEKKKFQKPTTNTLTAWLVSCPDYFSHAENSLGTRLLCGYLGDGPAPCIPPLPAQTNNHYKQPSGHTPEAVECCNYHRRAALHAVETQSVSSYTTWSKFWI